MSTYSNGRKACLCISCANTIHVTSIPSCNAAHQFASKAYTQQALHHVAAQAAFKLSCALHSVHCWRPRASRGYLLYAALLLQNIQNVSLAQHLPDTQLHCSTTDIGSTASNAGHLCPQCAPVSASLEAVALLCRRACAIILLSGKLSKGCACNRFCWGKSCIK